MKKIAVKSIVCLMAGTITLSSCIGSFGLFNKVLDWNKGISSKLVNELVFIIISPAYAVCGVVDLFVLNSVEFWSGKNPISKVGHVENVWGKDGRMYAVKTLKKGYEITRPTGEKVYFTYNKKDNSWSIEENGKVTEIFRFNEDGSTVQACLPDGRKMNVTLDNEGLYALQTEINGGTFFATR